jgi:hypothetical protein
MTPDNDIRPKWLTVAQLKSVLADLPDNYTLMPNRVGNLTVCSTDLEYRGFIDFLSEGCYEGELP